LFLVLKVVLFWKSLVGKEDSTPCFWICVRLDWTVGSSRAIGIHLCISIRAASLLVYFLLLQSASPFDESGFRASGLSMDSIVPTIYSFYLCDTRDLCRTCTNIVLAVRLSHSNFENGTFLRTLYPHPQGDLPRSGIRLDTTTRHPHVSNPNTGPTSGETPRHPTYTMYNHYLTSPHRVTRPLQHVNQSNPTEADTVRSFFASFLPFIPAHHQGNTPESCSRAPLSLSPDRAPSPRHTE
jgi:hypothetical protein